MCTPEVIYCMAAMVAAVWLCTSVLLKRQCCCVAVDAGRVFRQVDWCVRRR